MKHPPASVLALPLIVLLISLPAQADPQSNIGVQLGAISTSENNDHSWRFASALHWDLILGRNSNRDFGAGPFAQVATSWNDFSAASGASFHLPVHEYLPLVLSLGPAIRRSPAEEWHPAATAMLFWGSRSYNYTSWYVMAGGLSVATRIGFEKDSEKSIIITAHLDAQVLSLPFLMLYQAIAGP